jgi:hypothetical protein
MVASRGHRPLATRSQNKAEERERWGGSSSEVDGENYRA